MRRQAPVDITQNSDLLQLLDEVVATNRSRIVSRGSEPVAVISPVRKRRSRVEHAAANRQAFLASLGGWRHLVDTEALKREIEASRGSARPPIEL